MSWNTDEESNSEVQLTIRINGEVKTKNFPSDTTVEAAVKSFAEENHIKRFDVEDENGYTVEEDEGTKTLSEVGALTLTSVATGA